ncbi:D-alanine--D-alanine ligase [Parvicella tangerina]|uniref:D-alanine--D-alanine ligase n=1 Tax=Parvicella tangerina TaxID=2829795 RepID=A0A916JP63_9FLAO|nr:D-alanine--D-alanine ligase [Parvicella tangerina]CAG5084328.1 D-alanine--D-alanine ligase A [Parvicella tangerina]
MINVAVIEGGYSHEKVVSLKSAQTILEHLDKSKYKVFRIRIDNDGWFFYSNDGKMFPVDKNDFSVEINGEKVNFDFAFIMIHGTPGEDGKLQGYFELLHIPYSTCNHLLTALTFNKFVCNRLLADFGFSVAKAVMLNRGEAFDEDQIIQKIGLPCFVKPADGGSSFGVTKVKEQSQLAEAIRFATEEGNGTQALIESFMEGTEVSNGVYRNQSGIQVLPVTEIVSENEFFDFDAKYKGQSQEITPARISEEMTERIQWITEQIYDKLELVGICRIDYIIIGSEPHVIEINTVPGMSGESIVPKMARAAELPLPQLFDEVITYAMKG